MHKARNLIFFYGIKRQICFYITPPAQPSWSHHRFYDLILKHFRFQRCHNAIMSPTSSPVKTFYSFNQKHSDSSWCIYHAIIHPHQDFNFWPSKVSFLHKLLSLVTAHTDHIINGFVDNLFAFMAWIFPSYLALLIKAFILVVRAENFLIGSIS